MKTKIKLRTLCVNIILIKSNLDFYLRRLIFLMELTMAVSDILRAKGLTRWKSILKNEMH